MLRKKKEIDMHVKSISEKEIGKHDFRKLMDEVMLLVILECWCI